MAIIIILARHARVSSFNVDYMRMNKTEKKERKENEKNERKEKIPTKSKQ